MVEFIKSMLSNDNGVVSSNRVAMVLVLVMLLGWSTLSVYQTGTIPDLSEGWLTLIGILVGGTSLGKATDAVKTFKEKKSETTDEI